MTARHTALVTERRRKSKRGPWQDSACHPADLDDVALALIVEDLQRLLYTETDSFTCARQARRAAMHSAVTQMGLNIDGSAPEEPELSGREA